ncbi:endonuclease/exonuclease/phosphatase family protein [Leptolyngbya sp. FACHB-17]|uniref:endonuclease/exonuclease/phosphatase family protein n=1 Tax=unclassified Leptolyngbya TaxID=2650499 RepID=UPI001680A948|nr:endonuclease/exonuclease/phosphatase family protein [Leptolyngbya sp. FACHB-17]MBD2081111.1 endonuclease/exonuclease/phosphatase family protein [Leptolyngbya sp. FACHB-17]
MPISSRLLSITGWSYLVSLLLWLSFRLLFFDRFWWLALLNTIAPYLFLPLVILLPLALWHRRRTLFFGMILGCLLLVMWVQPRLHFFSKAVPTTPAGSLLKVMTFNILWSNQDYDKIAQMIRQTKPDLIGVQELQPNQLSNLLKAIAPDYPHHTIHPVDLFHTVALFSRLPIETAKPLPEPPIERGIQAIVRIGDQHLNVLVTHLAPNNMPLLPIDQFIAETRDRYARRAAEATYLKELVQQRLLPTLMLCDCNLTDTSEAYQQLRKHFKDSFQERGQGLGHTLFISGVPFPVQRIDYIWHSEELEAIDASVAPDGGSDHLPVVATLKIR